ncbi:glycosyltransferase family 4 protein [Vibrio fluvialis]|nr:glycosyltransferase family 4 protein [Vibrio fluvialis]
MKAAFVHDHVFLKHDDEYYSNGKLTYSQLSKYLKYFDDLLVIGRFKSVDVKPEESFKSNGDRVSVFGLNGPLSKNGIIHRKSLLDEYRSILSNVDVLISRLPSEHGILCNTVAKELGIKIINEMVASPFDCLWYRGDFIAKLYAPILSYRTKRAIYLSPNTIYVTKKYLQDCYPNNSHFQSCAISDVRIHDIYKKKTLSIKDQYVIGVIGNPALNLKNIRLLFDLVKMSNINLKLSIVGGSGGSPLEMEMNEHKNVELVGYVSDQKQLHKWFETLDIYIQPSFTEGLPRSIIEAMSHAIPVFGSNVGGIPELVHPDFLFSPKDVNKINALVNRCLFSHEQYEKLSMYSIDQASMFSCNLDVERDEFIIKAISE